MSLFTFPKVRSFLSSKGRRAERRRRASQENRKPRRLQIDPLEERALLSLAPADFEETWIPTSREPFPYFDPSLPALATYRAVPGDPVIRSPGAVAGQRDGDFVATWSRTDAIEILQFGNYVPLIDPVTGVQVVDSNIYARYFTDEVQRLTLPVGVLADAAAPYATITLKYGGTKIQKLSFSTTVPSGTNDFQQNIYDNVVLTFVNGTTTTSRAFLYRESDFLNSDVASRPDHLLQGVLRSVPGLQNAVVTAVNAREFLVDFGNDQLLDGATLKATFMGLPFATGLLRAADVTTVRQPVVMANIPISTNPNETAADIKFAFAKTSQFQLMPEWFVERPTYYPTITPAPYEEPATVRMALPSVEVVPVLNVLGITDGTVFDIRFVGTASKDNVPLVKLLWATSETGDPLGLPTTPVKTLKESSDEFRVNSFEPFHPRWNEPMPLQQSQPVVTMDADGEFIIAWTGEVPDTTTFASVDDVFARRFTTQSIVAPADAFEDPRYDASSPTNHLRIQGIRASGSEFRVNTTTVNRQGDPAVAMDPDGNFVIAWATAAQDLSFFNHLVVQRFNYRGDKVGPEIPVVVENTMAQFNPSLAMSPDGHFAVAWEETNDPRYFQNLPFTITSSMQVYNWNTGATTSPVINVNGFNAAMTFDTGNRLYLSCTFFPLTNGTTDVYAAEFSTTGTVLRDWFRVNSGSTAGTGASPTEWPMMQWYNQIGVDADGDFTVAFDGFGPDMSSPLAFLPSSYFSAAFNNPDNADLLPFVPFQARQLPSFLPWDSGQDMDAAMETVLFNADGLGATDVQLGRIRLIFEKVAGMLRGEADGVMFTQWDADQFLGPMTVLSSDNIANTRVDGYNERDLLYMDYRATAGSFHVWTNDRWNRAVEGDFTPIYYPAGPINPYETRKALENFLNSLTGSVNWPGPFNDWNFDGDGEPGVLVRILSLPFDNSEIIARRGTHWELDEGRLFGGVDADLDIVYEITFIGDMHDRPVGLATTRNDSFIRPTNIAVQSYSQERTDGDMGTTQWLTNMAMQPSGSFVAVWSENAEYSNTATSATNLYFRRFTESAETAGPTVTDVLRPTGERIANGGLLMKPLQTMVVTLDEDMARDGAGNVTDPSNWVLLRGGVEVVGGIRQIFFGMNKAADMAESLGLTTAGSDKWLGTNKWEAVIVFDSDSTDGVGNVTPLGDGRYQLVAKNSLRDHSGNPLARTGYQVNGANFTRDFEILVPRSDEAAVSPVGNADFTQDQAKQAVASSPTGSYAVVWTSVAGAGSTDPAGVYAQLYNTTWADTASGRTSEIVKSAAPILVTDAAGAGYANVAMDADGDFVVTWSQLDSEALGGWNVYYSRYSATGELLQDRVLVNTETRDVQKMSAVAMDAEGDFVVTWQSLKQDNKDKTKSGYGVYAQRYSPIGATVGGADEVQVLTFVGKPKGTFWLTMDGVETGPIAFGGNTFATASVVEEALREIGVNAFVQAIGQTELAVKFSGDRSSMDQSELQVRTDVTGDVDADILVSTLQDGTAGEFKVNDYTIGDQMWSSVAMSPLGEFVVSWTSFGQSGDPAWDSNVYAKKFVSNTALRGAASLSMAAQRLQTNLKFPDMSVQPFVVATDDPSLHVVGPNSQYNGVVQVNGRTATSAWFGSGSLLTSRMHILTAAHVVWDFVTNAPVAPGAITVTFNLPSGDVTIPAEVIFINPAFNGAVGAGGDIAVIQLKSPAPAEAKDYGIYTRSDELGRVYTRLGYGGTGTGATGSVTWDEVKREGQNRYEGLGSLFGLFPDTLVYDFDDGTSTHDAFGQLFGIPDVGLGKQESSAATGDSGGPTFIAGLIAGVCSYGTSLPGSHDVVAGTNSSFGDMAADTRVSVYAGWIDGILASGTSEVAINNVIAGDQKWSSVTMDYSGNFIVTWTSENEDGVGPGPGPTSNGVNSVMLRRFDAKSQPLAPAIVVNTFAMGDQQYSRVSADADGDYVVVWESFQDKPLPPYLANVDPDQPNSFGIFAQRFSLSGGPNVGPDGKLGVEFRVNDTLPGEQRYPGVALNGTGDFVVVWSGQGATDNQGVYYKRFENAGDVAGPIVADTLNVGVDDAGDPSLTLVRNGQILDSEVSRFVFDFSEEMSVEGGIIGMRSVLNPANWELTRGGVTIYGGVKLVDFRQSLTGPESDGGVGLRPTSSGKWEAIVTFDADPDKSGIQSLGVGSYVLTLRDSVQDIFGNTLDGNYDGAPGSDFQRKFSIELADAGNGGGAIPGDPKPGDKDTPVSDPTLGNGDAPAVATDPQGNYVVVWTESAVLINPATGLPVLDANGNPIIDSQVVAQRYNRLSQKLGRQFTVNSAVTGAQGQADVATDLFGNFVVVWSGSGVGDTVGIYGRRFDPFGVPQGPEFRINQFVVNSQTRPAVDMDRNGNFVVTWESVGNTSDFAGVWARRYNTDAVALGNEFRVNTYTQGVQARPDVAADSDGNFAVVWQSELQDGSFTGVYAQRYTAAGALRGAEFRVNTYTPSNQADPQIAMDAAGDFVVGWSSVGQDGSGYGIYAKRYTAAGAASSEFRVNKTTASWQYQPAVAMNAKGAFIVSWTGWNTQTELASYDVFARSYNSDGSDLIDPVAGNAVGEFRVNADTDGKQYNSALAMADSGNFVAVWTGTVVVTTPPGGTPPTVTPTGIFQRAFLGGADAALMSTTASLNSYKGWSGGWSGGVALGQPPVVISGTAGNDTIVITAGATRDTWSITVNGRAVGAGTQGALVFDGRGGVDTVKLTGLAGDDRFEAWPDHLLYVTPSLTFKTVNTEKVVIAGGGGADELILHDSEGDDTLNASPSGVSMTVTGGAYAVSSGPMAKVTAYGGLGADTAVFTGGAGVDKFVGKPTYGELTGAGYALRANAFDVVSGVANGAADLAELYDSAGNDALYSVPAYTKLYGAGFNNVASGFKKIEALADAGGRDVATIYDGVGNDTAVGNQSRVQMQRKTEATVVGATGFESVVLQRKYGGTDVATLTDSALADLLQAGGTSVKVTYNASLNRAIQVLSFSKSYVKGSNPVKTYSFGSYPTATKKTI